MRIDTRKKHQVNILTFTGKMFHGDGDVMLDEEFRRLLDRGERLFVFDMKRLSCIDSMGLGRLIACHKRVRERDGIIRLVLAPNGKPYQIIVMTCLYKVFDVHDDVEEALTSFIPGTMALNCHTPGLSSG